MNQRGVSALEIVAVLAIIGLALSFMPSNQNFNNKANYETSRSNLRDILQRARNTASANQECSVITINPQSVTFVSYNMGGTICVAPFINPDVTFTVKFDPTVTVTQTTPLAIVFSPQGSYVDNAGNVAVNPATINLTQFSYSSTFTIQPLVGQITEGI